MRARTALVVLSAVFLSGCTSGRTTVVETRPFAHAPDALADAGPFLAEQFGRAAFTAADGTRIPYRVLMPPPRAGGGRERMPVVLVLHGSGAIGEDNERQLGVFARSWARPDVAAAFPACVVVPQVPARSADYAPDADEQLAAQAGSTLPALLELAEALARRDDVDPSRVYVVGFSMGGSTALRAAADRPGRFAAAVSFSGIAPPRALAARTTGTPQFLVHGTADDENPIGPDRAWAAAVAAAGGHIRLVEVAGMDHRVPPDMVASHDWRAWLFAQRRR